MYYKVKCHTLSVRSYNVNSTYAAVRTLNKDTVHLLYALSGYQDTMK